MSKINLDDLLQQKLQGMDVEFKPEYWDQMAEKLEASAPTGSNISNAGGGISNTFIAASIAVIITALTVIAYFTYFNNSLATEPITDSVETPTDGSFEDLSSGHNTAQPCGEITNYSNETVKVSYEQISKNTQVKPNTKAKLTKATPLATETQNSTVIEVDSDETIIKESTVSIDLDTTDDKVTAIPDTIVVVRHPSENTYLPKVENGNNETFAPSAEAEKKDENLKDVTPIDKPAKKVFRKRNGFFWFLGFRK